MFNGAYVFDVNISIHAPHIGMRPQTSKAGGLA